MNANVLQATAPGRHRRDLIMRGFLLAATIVALIPLALVLYYVIKKGVGAWSADFFTTDPTGAFIGDPGGIKSALLGTIEIVALASATAIPVGVGVAVYLVEYGKQTVFARAVRYFVDVLTGVPSIVFGLFVYIVLILGGGFGGFAAWKGSIALALLMLPVVTRASEVVLNTVPDALREGALALGAPRWRIIGRIVLPTALPGLVTGSLLAIARAAGETAPLLFTAFAINATTFKLGGPMNSLPLQIWNDVRQAQDRLVERAWGAALALIVLILLLTLTARILSRRSRLT
ncbi:MAG: phosphate ABC transporter permease PstA [Thermoleophilaceae bacterium]